MEAKPGLPFDVQNRKQRKISSSLHQSNQDCSQNHFALYRSLDLTHFAGNNQRTEIVSSPKRNNHDLLRGRELIREFNRDLG